MRRFLSACPCGVRARDDEVGIASCGEVGCAPPELEARPSACQVYPRARHGAEATREVVWWDRTRAEYITITITLRGH